MITHLAISGGGSSGIKFTGSLKYLEETNQLKNLKCILGTSIGAIIAVLLSYSTVDNIIDNIKNINGIKKDDISLKLLLNNLGLFSKKQILHDLSEILQKTFHKIPTFL